MTCSSWSPTSQHWDDGACETRFHYDDEAILCLCDHLSEAFYQLTKGPYQELATEPDVLLYKTSDPLDYWIVPIINDVAIDLQNGAWSDTGVEYEVQVFPTNLIDTSKLQLSYLEGILSFDADSLERGTSYQIKVTARNTTYDNVGNSYVTAESVRWLNFTTQRGPYGGSFVCNPPRGVAMRTEITAQLTGW